MGFPILSLIVTRIIGIPQSLLLRVLGFPNSHPGSMGFPMPFFRLSPKVFFVSGIVTFIAKSHEFPLVFAITAARPCSLGRHWLYLEVETWSNVSPLTLKGNSPIVDLRRPAKLREVPKNSCNGPPNFKDCISTYQYQKGREFLREDCPTRE